MGDLPVGPLTKGLKALFMKAYKEYSEKSVVLRVCTITDSTSDSEDYSWLGAVPKIREFLAERRAKSLANFNYNLKNQTWENTIGVKRSDLEDNKLGMLRTRIRQLAQEAVRYKEEKVMSFLTSALGSDAAPYLCYDGTGLIDTAHTATSEEGGATQSNRAGTALAIATLWTAIGAMRGFKDDTGRILGMVPDTLLVEPCLEQTAFELLEPISASAQSAALKHLNIEPVVSSYLYSTATAANGNWFLLDSQSEVKGVILQERTSVEFGSLEKDSDSGFLRDEFLYGTRARWAVGAGFWPAIYGNAGAG